MTIITYVMSNIMRPPIFYSARGLFLCVFLCVLCAHRMQAQDTYAERTTLRAVLNHKLQELNMPGITTVSITAAEVGTLNLKGLFGDCLVIDTDPVIVLKKNGTTVTLEVQTAPAGTMNIPPGSHRMVCDLQTAWLKRSWGYTMHDSIADHRLGKEGGNPCYDDLRFAQDYFTWGAGDIATKPRMLDTLKMWLDDWSADYLPRTYRTVTDNMLLTEGNQTGLATFSRLDPDDYITYIARRRALSDSDVADAKLSYTRVQFHPAAAMTGDIVTEVTIEAHLRRYQPTDCFEETYPWLEDAAPDPDSAYVKISYVVKNTSTSVEQVHQIWKKFSSTDIPQDNEDLWEFFDPNVQYLVDGWCNFEIDTEGYLIFTAHPGSGDHSCTLPGTFRIMRLRSPIVSPQLCQFAFAESDTFRLDPMTGELICRHNGITGIDSVEVVPCLQFCTVLSGYRTMDNVIAASAQRLDNSVPYDTAGFLRNPVLGTWQTINSSNNIYELGEGRWRPSEGYAYRTAIRGGGKISIPNERVYRNAGVFLTDGGSAAEALRLFDWRNPAANADTKWLLASTATLFSPFGDPLEERDIIGIYSAARFSHHNIMPSLVAKNARYSSVGYESFEDGRGTVNTVAHSGRWSLLLGSSFPGSGVMKLVVTDQMRSNGVLVRFWAKQTYTAYSPTVLPAIIDGSFGTGTMKKIAQTGEWTLYEQICDVSASSAGAVIDLKFKSGLSSDMVWVDDVRAQPFDAEVICYAYDQATLRTVAQFDDQHFGIFYQYNGQGQLVRTLRETERGIVTVEERQYHVPDMYDRGGEIAGSARYGGGSRLPLRMLGPVGSADGSIGDGGSNGRQEGGWDRIDLLDLSVDAGGVHGNVLGGAVSDLSRLNIDSLRALIRTQIERFSPSQIEKLGAAGLKDVTMVGDLLEVRELERRMAALEERRNGELSDEDRRAIESALTDLAEHRRQLMRERLGVDEDQPRELYRSLEQHEQENAEGEE